MLFKDIVLRCALCFVAGRLSRTCRTNFSFISRCSRKGIVILPMRKRQARVKFGSIDRVAEEMRDARGVSTIDRKRRQGCALRNSHVTQVSGLYCCCRHHACVEHRLPTAWYSG